MGEALKNGSISEQTLVDVVKGLNAQRPAGNTEYMQSILNLVEILAEYRNDGFIYRDLGVDLERIAAAETGRLRCIVLNTIDAL